MSTSASPPTLTPEQAAEQAHMLEQLVYWIGFTLTGFACFYAIMCWDMLNNLGNEIQLVWKTKSSPVKFLYIFNRYWAFIAMTATLFLYNIHATTAGCNRYVKLEPILPIPLVISYQAVLITRCFAMYKQSKFIIAGFVPLLVGELVYLVYVVTRCEALPYPAAKGPCIVTGPNDIITGYFLVPWAVDLVITVVTFFKAFQLYRITPNSTVLAVFVKEGLLFFAVVFLCNLLNGILYVQSNPFIRPIFAGGSFIISSIMTSRLILSLRKQQIADNATSSRIKSTNTYPMTKRTEISVGKMIPSPASNEEDDFDMESQNEKPRHGIFVSQEVVTQST